jgi:hypothetical protein
VVFILTSFAGARADADIGVVEVCGEVLGSSEYSVTRLSEGQVELTPRRQAIPTGLSDPLLVEMEATVDARTVSGVGIPAIPRGTG